MHWREFFPIGWRDILPAGLGVLLPAASRALEMGQPNSYGIGTSFLFFVAVVGVVVLLIRGIAYKRRDRWGRLFFGAMLLTAWEVLKVY